MWGLALGLSSCLGGCFFSGYVGGGGGGPKNLVLGGPVVLSLCAPCPNKCQLQELPTAWFFSIVLIASTKVLWLPMLSSYCYGKP